MSSHVAFRDVGERHSNFLGEVSEMENFVLSISSTEAHIAYSAARTRQKFIVIIEHPDTLSRLS